MSSLVRRIQRASKRQIYHLRRGSMVGVHNPKATDLLARKAREERKKA
jgi:hypothetical protein